MTAALLETPRLRVRPAETDDAAFIVELVNDPAWLRFIGERHVRTPADALGYIAKTHAMQRAHGVSLHVVALQKTGEAIGLCGLLQRDHLPELDLGFAYLARFRGQGFAREAAAAMLQHGHATLGRERILALVHPENRDSIALLGKLGFVFERTVPRPDGVVDTHVFVHRATRSQAKAV